MSRASRYRACCTAFVVSSSGAWPGGSPPVTPGPVVTRSPHPGVGHGARWFSHVPELPLCRPAPLSDPGGVLRTCQSAPRTAAFRRWHTVGFVPRSRCGSPAGHASPYCGAPSRGLPPRSRQLRTPSAGLARGVRSCPAGEAFGRGDLSPRARTHWVTTTHFIGFLLLPRFRAYLGASKRWLGCGSHAAGVLRRTNTLLCSYPTDLLPDTFFFLNDDMESDRNR